RPRRPALHAALPSWPSSYHTPPSAVAAVFGGLLTKVGIYGFFRVFTLIFVPDDFIKAVLMGIAVMTILTGAFGAIIKDNIRRILDRQSTRLKSSPVQ